VREWQDLVGQLRDAVRELRMEINQTPAEPDDVHRALLAGLLSHIGTRDQARREYQGARGARFAIFPGSSLARRQPNWVMAAELVETSRLWGREVARIEPAWVEPLAEHLARRQYSEPRWDRRRAAVVATERVTVYGLPIVTGRTVAYGSIDPQLSRELFIRCALVERDWDTRHAFFAENGRELEAIDELERRTRRRDVLVADEVLFEFFDERIPADVVSGAHFDRWWRDERREHPDLLTYTRELLVAPQAADALDADGRPSTWRQGDLSLALSYEFSPGSDRDGVTVHVPLKTLPQLRPDGFEWLVPALREELVTALLRALPKDLRRPLAPVPDTAAQVLAALEPRREPLLDALAREVQRFRGVRVPPGTWDLAGLPAHLRMTFRVEDDDGELVAEGKDIAALRAEVRPRLRAELSAAAAGLERAGLTEWSIGDLPRIVALPGTGQTVRGYPALVDEGQTVAVRVFDTPGAQAAAMAVGTRRLLLLGIPSPIRYVTDRLSGPARLALAAAPHGSAAAVLDDVLVAAVDAQVARAGGPAWNEVAFAQLRGEVAGELADETLHIASHVVEILDAAGEVQQRLGTLRSDALQEARQDVARQLGRLVYPGFVAATGAARLPDVLRYLRAAARRLERLPDKPAVDRDRMRAIHELEQAYERRRAAGRPLPEVPWMLEELRVSQFAQGLGTRQPVSAKRIRRAIES
jgi:ATP-dependent helicase HrpA